jgi:hypothetical protein
LLLLAAVAVATSAIVATPRVARASGGMTETGVTTYEIVPSLSAIQVTIQISIANTTPNEDAGGGLTYYYWNSTGIMVPVSAGEITATSNADAVTQSIESSDQYYKVVKLSYPSVYYNQTRVVTATYSIPAAPGAKGGFRAGTSYASLCAVGNGQDTGSVSVVAPDGFSLQVLSGDQIKRTVDLGGKQIFSSGTISKPGHFYSCVEATSAALTHTAATAGEQAFDLQGWPEDTTWSRTTRDELAGSVQGLDDLLGLKMPGNTISILESDGGLQDQGISYNPAKTTVSLPENATRSQLIHALAHVWFNADLLKDQWTSEGLARFSEKAAGHGNYAPCTAPGAYPGSGTASLATWQFLSYDSALQESNVATWQSDASCYFFTKLADAIGADGFKAVLRTLAAGEMAYIGATPGEKPAGGSKPLTAMQVLDLFDEIGMVPAGVTDLNQAQAILSSWGVFDSTALAARSSSRSAYHALIATARGWKLPLAVRGPMAVWDFTTADKEMAVATQILALREQIAKTLPGFSLDATAIQKQFESAVTPSDMDGLLALTKKEADAAGKVDSATKLRAAGTNLIQAIGLVGADPDKALAQARADLQGAKPEAASSGARAVMDQVNGAGAQGLLRIAAGAVLLVLLLLVALLGVFHRRRRQAVSRALAEIGATMVAAKTIEPTAEASLRPTAAPEAEPANTAAPEAEPANTAAPKAQSPGPPSS